MVATTIQMEVMQLKVYLPAVIYDETFQRTKEPHKEISVNRHAYIFFSYLETSNEYSKNKKLV